MISDRTIKTFELDKILKNISEYCVLQKNKEDIIEEKPDSAYAIVKYMLDKTNEAFSLLFEHKINGVEFYDNIDNELEIAKKKGMLSCAELLKCARLLKSSRLTSTSILNVEDEKIKLIPDECRKIYYDHYLENEITTKIISEDQIADNATNKLFEIRRAIKTLNEKIRERLLSYMKGRASQYLQDNVVSMRNGRYVVPVKSEYKTQVKGLIHDQSASGSTFFIEPTEILELNNDLREQYINEKLEIESILYDLSNKIGLVADKLVENMYYLLDLDRSFAKAFYAYKIRGVYPKINTNGKINIIEGRHPLIDKDKVVPVSVALGDKYNYILISGPNTGGKTVTLKLVGLLTLMAYLGIFIPAGYDSEISIFDSIYCDIGDEQSIEQSLSTFSSHIKNIINITENADCNSLVLVDEIGAGTDPDEGSAIACSVLDYLISVNSFGIITTHYSLLKEYAYSNKKIMNSSMDFDGNTYEPLYKLRIGMPGTSNAIEISRRLGLDSKLIEKSKEFLSKDKIEYNNILQEAEKVKTEAKKERDYYLEIKSREEQLLKDIEQEKNKLARDREKFLANAKVESRKLVNEKLEEAEEMLKEMKDIFNKEEYENSDLVKMATLKNKIDNQKYILDTDDEKIFNETIDIKTLKKNDSVYVVSMDSIGQITDIAINKNKIKVQVGSINVSCDISNIKLLKNKPKEKTSVKVSAQLPVYNEPVKLELNVIGKTVDEAMPIVDNFIDTSIYRNIETVRIVHGKGLRILGRAIQEHLRKDPRIKEIRFGKYGEGEDGVTIVTL